MRRSGEIVNEIDVLEVNSKCEAKVVVVRIKNMDFRCEGRTPCEENRKRRCFNCNLKCIWKNKCVI